VVRVQWGKVTFVKVDDVMWTFFLAKSIGGLSAWSWRATSILPGLRCIGPAGLTSHPAHLVRVGESRSEAFVDSSNPSSLSSESTSTSVWLEPWARRRRRRACACAHHGREGVPGHARPLPRRPLPGLLRKPPPPPAPPPALSFSVCLYRYVTGVRVLIWGPPKSQAAICGVELDW